MPSTTEHYRKLLDVSRRMLDAGMAQRWDELIDLERQRRGLFENLPAGASGNADNEMIREIQACDAQLAEKLEAWMAHVRILLRMDKPASS